MRTLLLDIAQWDLVTNAAGDIAVAEDPYALAQDVASAIRTFLAEVWYDQSLGVAYFQQILGQAPPISLFEQLMSEAAESVTGVASAACSISAFADRRVTGRVTFTSDNGATQTVSIQ